ncbi:MAG: putative addiction module component [Bacteroidetes bacterium]|nr:putative addiction module component [Bacteroidota bacterium]
MDKVITMLKKEYKSLSVAEKILLVEEIWDSIAEDAAIKLSEGQKELLEERQNKALRGEVSKKTWEEIKNDVRNQK